MASLANCNLLLIVTGGIAAYKTPELVRRLRDEQANVRVVMTAGAQAFIQPLTLQAVSGQPVHDDLLDPAAEAAMGHIELARWADLVVVAPASANALARLAHGHADDLFTTLCLATDAPVAVAPAMNRLMWAARPTQRNLELLQADGKLIWGPAAGSQACGETGAGRMLEPASLLEHIQAFFQATQRPQVLAGKRVLLTAGPTRENLDPVRYLSNFSSGKMGFALAQATQLAGAQVTLIAGPCQLDTPPGVTRVDVTTADEMLAAVQEHLPGQHIFIGCAAVADYKPASVSEQKLKKQAGTDHMTVELVRNPDILAWVGQQDPGPYTVGFAAETSNLAAYAEDKLARKGARMIVANDVSQSDQGFNSDHNAATVFWYKADGLAAEQGFAPMPKTALAAMLVDLIAEQYGELRSQQQGYEEDHSSTTH